MQKGFIATREFCESHQIEISFISLLRDARLLEVTTIGETGYLAEDQLHRLEKIVRMHYDLDINLEGIETITHLLERMGEMQSEIAMLRSKLRFYEGDL